MRWLRARYGGIFKGTSTTAKEVEAEDGDAAANATGVDEKRPRARRFIVQHDRWLTYSVRLPARESFGWSDIDTLDVTLLDIVHPEDMESPHANLASDTLVRPARFIEIDPFRHPPQKRGSWMYLPR